MIRSIDHQDQDLPREIAMAWAAGLLVFLALLWVASAAFGAWLAYDQCNLPNDNGVTCDKTLDYRLSVYQPALAVLGALAALLASRRLSPRARRHGASPDFAVPLAVAVSLFALWIGALTVT